MIEIVITLCLNKSSRFLIFHNLKKLLPAFIFLVPCVLYPNIMASKHMHNFQPHNQY